MCKNTFSKIGNFHWAITAGLFLKLAIGMMFLSRFDCLAFADEIHFKNGKIVNGEVTQYQNGTITIVQDNGKTISGSIAVIRSINFETSTKTNDKPLPASKSSNDLDDSQGSVADKRLIARAIENVSARESKSDSDSAVVGLVVRAAGASGPVEVTYRCYQGGGYSGIRRFNTQAPWATIEQNASRNAGVRKIVLDAGPRYEKVSIDVVLVPGQPTNLGVIPMKAVKQDRKFMVHGKVVDLDNNAMSKCPVSMGRLSTTTDSNGNYTFKNVRIGEYELVASANKHGSVPHKLLIDNNSPEKVEQTIYVFRPKTISFRYVISDLNNDSFGAQSSQPGEFSINFERQYAFWRDTVSVSNDHMQSFISDTLLRLHVKDGEIYLSNGRGPIAFTSLETNTNFDAIDAAGEPPAMAHRHPRISKGSVIIIRGFRGDTDRQSGYNTSPYCVKLEVSDIQDTK
ncbi:hypothetical protein Pla22_13010 [Rubripirellula amarantea]|uniref:Carboxypeptidase regulatory-like domain-containing protein n=1 Tax=Rubripirellula amarantea TaxID=2527999 RepID=A0A5C5WT51_9BACT|nr:carboxypeptidase-like regulatory domain-containing protein [Rubripirellula amarantea]TWT53670.1 hypothetical protein Pla22_13010 [Rubripirellula amarantea]